MRTARPVPGSDPQDADREASARKWGFAVALLAMLAGTAAVITSLGMVFGARPSLAGLVQLTNGAILVALAGWSFFRRTAAYLAMSAQVSVNVLLSVLIVFASGAARDLGFVLGFIGGSVLVAGLVVTALVKSAEREGERATVLHVLGIFVAMTLVELTLGFLAGMIFESNPALILGLSILVTAGTALLVWKLESDIDFGWMPPRSGLVWAGCLVSAPALGWIAGRYMDILLYAFGPGLLAQARMIQGIGLVPKLALIVLIGPVAEEVLFRGVFQAKLTRAWGAPTALVATAFIFATAHAMPAAFPLLLLAGLTLGLARHYSGSILPGIAFHVVYNAMAVL